MTLKIIPTNYLQLIAKMKKAAIIIVTAILSVCISGCNSKNKSAEQAKDTIGITIKKDSLTLANNSKDSTGSKSNKAEKLIGIWMASDSQSPDFEIKKSTIRYFNHSGTVPYKIIGDSINIVYGEKYRPSFLFTLKGDDTLILTGGTGETTLYRIKK